MPGAYHHRGKWNVWWVDGTGKRRHAVTAVRTKADAKRIARELDAKGERQRMGLEPILPSDGGGTVLALLKWWRDTYVAGTPSLATVKSALGVHFEGSDLAGMTLASVRPTHVEAFIQSKAAERA